MATVIHTIAPFHNSSSSTSFSPKFSLNRQSSQLFGQTLNPLTIRNRIRPSSSPPASGLWDAITGGNSTREALFAIRRGMTLFRQGDVSGSIVEFDKAIQLDPRQKAYLWQRGLSLYYVDRFEEGAEQFRIDVAQNPNDTEESIWCFLCEAQLYGADEARKRFLEVGKDPRPVMREAYNMFKDGGDPEKLNLNNKYQSLVRPLKKVFREKGSISLSDICACAPLGYKQETELPPRFWNMQFKLAAAFVNGREHEFFYASLYAGLYYESQKEPDGAKLHITAACQSPYGLRADDYMASLAKVHSLCRKWSS